MAKYSHKMMGKEVGSAEVYAEPHTMSGKKVTAQNALPKPSTTSYIDSLGVSVGNISREAKAQKNTPIKIRGTGAATKGTMARGPMG